jgi:hypothetical protein
VTPAVKRSGRQIVGQLEWATRVLELRTAGFTTKNTKSTKNSEEENSIEVTTVRLKVE